MKVIKTKIPDVLIFEPDRAISAIRLLKSNLGHALHKTGHRKIFL